jgi:uracil DNA glycosylase
MLNICLTVRKGEAKSHQNKKSEIFTATVIKQHSRRENIVYML